MAPRYEEAPDERRSRSVSKRSNSQKIMKGIAREISDMLSEKKLCEPGGHCLLIYEDLRVLSEIYSQYSRAFLPQNEIIVIATQYASIRDTKTNLRLAGVDVEQYLNQGTLFIVDAQQGYQGADSKGIWKLCMSLLSRAKKEGRRGVTLFGDLGSFFCFEKIEELMEYELWCPRKNEDDKMKTVCCYHLKDFEKLRETQKQTLLDHHFKSILVE